MVEVAQREVDEQSAILAAGVGPHAAARAAIAAGLERLEAHLRDGLTRMQTRGKLRKDADPAALATATMASIQGGLLLTQVRRDPHQFRIALNSARANLRLLAA